MVLQVLNEFIELLRSKGAVMQELEDSLRAKGAMSREEETKLRAVSVVANAGFALIFATFSLQGWFVLGQGARFAGVPPMPGLLRFGVSAGGAFISGKVMYYTVLHVGAKFVLEHGEERTKMELANIILTKHSDEKSLGEAVKRHFFAEHLFSDQYQDRQVFRWHLRHSYIDSAFMERMKEIEKEIEANDSDNEARSISGQTTSSFGDLMEDPLACILGSQDSNMESNEPPKYTGTILRRSELRAHRRSHRRRDRHADKFAAL